MDGLQVYVLDADGNVVAMQQIGTAALVNTLSFGGINGAKIEIRKDPAKTDTVISLAEVIVSGRQRVWLTSTPSAAPSLSSAPTNVQSATPSLAPSSSSAPTHSVPARNLALNKPASHKCNYGSYAASRGVDGRISTARSATTITCRTDYSWWKVDLQAMKEIDRVAIWNRGDCCQASLSNFYLKFLDDKGNLVKQIYHEGGLGMSKVLNVENNVNARYVQIQLTSRRTALSLVEVQVHGWDLI